MKRSPISLSKALALVVAGIILGSVFCFGTQYWNKQIAYEECIKIETQFVGHKEIKRRGHIREIAIDCANGERYFIDGVSVSSGLCDTISMIPDNEVITLHIHPNSNTILELSIDSSTVLEFSETRNKLGAEATGFVYLGLFMYFCSLVGMYYVVRHIICKRRTK